MRKATFKDLPAPCCGNCDFYDRPEGAGIGLCVRFPATVQKAADRICGEHPRFKQTPKSEAA